MTKKNARKTAARGRQAKVGGKYTDHLEKATQAPKLEGTLREHLRWLLAEHVGKGMTSDRKEAIIQSLTEQLKDFLAKDRQWQPSVVMGYLVTEVTKQVPGVVTEALPIEEGERKRFQANGRSINVAVTPEDISFSTAPGTGGMGGTPESNVESIVWHLTQTEFPVESVDSSAKDPANKVMVNREPYQLQLDKQDVFDALFTMYSKGSVSINDILALFNLEGPDTKHLPEGWAAAPKSIDYEIAPKSTDMFTVNDSAFNDIVREVYQKKGPQGPEQDIRGFLRWLRTKGPEALVSGDSQAFIAAEDLVEEYLGKKAHPWRVDNMGHAIANDVKRDLSSVEVERLAVPYEEIGTRWVCTFTANGRSIEMDVTQNVIRLSTGPNDKAAGYHDMVSAVQAILRHLKNEPKGGRMREAATFPSITRLELDRTQATSLDALAKKYGLERLPAQRVKGDNGWKHVLAESDWDLRIRIRARVPGMSNDSRTIEPGEVMAYWKDLPEAKKCADAKSLRMGVTDDHPEHPFITWTGLGRSKGCPGFSEWWTALPEAKPYHR